MLLEPLFSYQRAYPGVIPPMIKRHPSYLRKINPRRAVLLAKERENLAKDVTTGAWVGVEQTGESTTKGKKGGKGGNRAPKRGGVQNWVVFILGINAAESHQDAH